ncbi:MAG: hypothetical protein AB7O78_12780 [Thermoleophilia bacterium]
MREILPGVWHWPTVHERHGIEISSYLLGSEGVVIDPRVPAGGLEAIEAIGPPSVAILSNRHHYRHAGRFAEAFGTRVLVNRLGAQEFTHGEPVEFFDAGDELPGGVRSVPVGALCPDETALFIPAHRAVAVADGLVRWQPEGPLDFVPDMLMHDPERTKQGLVAAYRKVLELDWDTLLLAHGRPLVGEEGRREMTRVVEAQG